MGGGVWQQKGEYSMAQYCMECGATLTDHTGYCAACGAPTRAAGAGADYAQASANPIESGGYQMPKEYLDPNEPQGGYNQQGAYGNYAPPTYAVPPPPGGARHAEEQEPSPNSPYAPVGIGAFLGAQLLLCIPVVNLIVMIVWACGGCRKINLRNYARAWLILAAIGFVLSILFAVLLGAVFSQYANEFGEFFDMLSYV